MYIDSDETAWSVFLYVISFDLIGEEEPRLSR
jgi:hypothetical protein